MKTVFVCPISPDFVVHPTLIGNKMGCFNDPHARKFVGGVGGFWVADTNYLYPARWGWINFSHQMNITVGNAKYCDGLHEAVFT